jgi:predicted Zn-dependent peptidase
LFIVVIPKPDREGPQIRDTIFKEISNLATSGPSADEMEKLRNNLFNGAVRSRQSSQFRSQQIAEFTLYDGDPHLFNTDLQNYLDVTPQQIRDAVKDFLDTDNRVLLEIVPAPADAAAAAPQPPGEPDQPAAPPAQVPPAPPREPAPTGPIAASDEPPAKD